MHSGTRWTHSPLLHFLAGGALLFALVHRPGVAAEARRDATPPGDDPIVVTAADVDEMRAAYRRETGLEATSRDETALVEQRLDEEILFREALARGLDRSDRSIRGWLVEQARVLFDGIDDEDELHRRALGLGLVRRDLVVRRILVQKMRLLAARDDVREPEDGELAELLARSRQEYGRPGSVTLRQVFFASGRDREAARRRAGALLRSLSGGRATRPWAAAPPAAAGDPSPMPGRLVAQSPAQLAKVFGEGFREAVASAPVGTWTGPIASAHGEHVVFVEGRVLSGDPDLASVRARLVEAWREERRVARLAELLRDARRRHAIRVESAAWQERTRA